MAQDQDKILAILKKSDKAKEARKKNAAAVAKYFDEVVKKLPPAKQTERKKSMAAAAKANKTSSDLKESAAKSSASATSGLGGSSGSKAAASEAVDSYLCRKYDSLNTAMDDLLRQAVSPQVRVLSDAKNGCWRITWASEGTTEQRSISWTSVGAKVAAEQTLKQAWEWSATHRGKGMSEKASKILAAIRDYAA